MSWEIWLGLGMASVGMISVAVFVWCDRAIDSTYWNENEDWPDDKDEQP